ncbi:hypothetical protein [Melissospora conviva]|uniref:hypothetical protein n=1 Tax=Melissospora conviva TaxID=3388432 RepID=UPI003B80FB95
MPELIKKVLTWGFLAFVIFYIAYRPDGAAQIFKAIGGGLMVIFQGFGDFFTGLVS